MKEEKTVVYKFGGASVKDADAVRNMAQIIAAKNGHQRLLVVVSAMGKTTNALEHLLSLAYAGEEESLQSQVAKLKEYHQLIVSDLFGSDALPMQKQVELYVDHLTVKLKSGLAGMSPEQLYDQVVSFGELLSSRIVYEYLLQQGLPVRLVEARNFIRTDEQWRDAKVDMDLTYTLVRAELPYWLEKGIVLTQGFVGGTVSGLTTTLGREGSDYSAALFAAALEADALIIWKDVPGVLNADPKKVSNTHLFSHLSYTDAAEMTFYGATVLHPKTIKPVANAGIPLYVRSFLNPAQEGTCIHAGTQATKVPTIVFKENQTFVTCQVRDITFIGEGGISTILQLLDALHVRINMMQRSAISFSIVMDAHQEKLDKLKEYLDKHFEVTTHTALTLLTIKNGDKALEEELCMGKEILMQQHSNTTTQCLLMP
jgi:aspartate kinase